MQGQNIPRQEKLDFTLQCSRLGNSALHYAVIEKKLELAKSLFEISPKVCLKINFKGKSAVHLAVEGESIDILHLFKDHKMDALLIRDIQGENPLFTAARLGNV